MTDELVVTPELDSFLEAYNKDNNVWWEYDSGHHQNLFEEACAELERLRTEVKEWHELWLAIQKGEQILPRPEWSQDVAFVAFMLDRRAKVLSEIVELGEQLANAWQDMQDCEFDREARRVEKYVREADLVGAWRRAVGDEKNTGLTIE